MPAINCKIRIPCFISQQIQTKCAACNADEEIQKMGDEEEIQPKLQPLIQREEVEEIQMKQEGSMQTASPEVSNQIQNRETFFSFPDSAKLWIEETGIVQASPICGVSVHIGLPSWSCFTFPS